MKKRSTVIFKNKIAEQLAVEFNINLETCILFNIPAIVSIPCPIDTGQAKLIARDGLGLTYINLLMQIRPVAVLLIKIHSYHRERKHILSLGKENIFYP